MHRTILVAAAMALFSQTAAGALAGTPAGPTVTSFALFARLRADCTPAAAARTWFRNNVASVSWAASFTGWSGLHSYRVDWVRPNGVVYDSEGRAATGAGDITSCNREFIAGYPAARRRGVWQVRLYVDGQLTRVLRFHLYGPDPRKTHIVWLRSVWLYANLNDRRCRPAIRPRLFFHRSARSIDYRLDFLDWEGTHTYHVAWIEPGGVTYDTQDYTGTIDGGVAFCNGELIHGEDAATHPGRWRLQVGVDGRLRRVVPFTLARR